MQRQAFLKLKNVENYKGGETEPQYKILIRKVISKENYFYFFSWKGSISVCVCLNISRGSKVIFGTGAWVNAWLGGLAPRLFVTYAVYYIKNAIVDVFCGFSFVARVAGRWQWWLSCWRWFLSTGCTEPKRRRNDPRRTPSLSTRPSAPISRRRRISHCRPAPRLRRRRPSRSPSRTRTPPRPPPPLRFSFRRAWSRKPPTLIGCEYSTLFKNWF